MRAFPHNANNHNANLDLVHHYTQRLRNVETQMHCFTQNPQTYAAALQAAQTHESALLRRKAAKDAVGAMGDDGNDARSEVNVMGSKNNNVKCWFQHCGGSHYADDCPMLQDAEDFMKKRQERRQRNRGRGRGRNRNRNNNNSKNKNNNRSNGGVNNIEDVDAFDGDDDQDDANVDNVAEN